MAFVEISILVAVSLIVFYKWSRSKHDHLRQRGIPHEKPTFFYGNTSYELLTGKKSFLVEILDNYQKFKDEKIYGTYSFHDAQIVIRDPELLKKICIKDFDSFPNHRTISMPESIFSKTLISLQDQKWRRMRNTLTPAFTGSKMRLMTGLINECCTEAVKYLDEEIRSSGKNEFDMEMKDFFSRFTNDVIATAAFGIKVNSFKDKQNEFYTVGSQITSFKGWATVKLMFFLLIPKVMKMLGADLMSKQKLNYFRSLVIDAIEYRSKHNIVRNDMIRLLMEAKSRYESLDEKSKSELADFNDQDILLAQCLIFFIAGFATVSACLCFTAHELLMNQEVQERLYEEIKETEKELDGKPIDYETLSNMKYMDMVLSESLRLWPPAIVTDRVCAVDYKLTDEDGKLVTELKKGDFITIPMLAIHRDPQYFPDPNKFDPERFNDDNKNNIPNNAYLPFGIGPRNCIGNRFALMETKSILYHLLLKFKITPSEKTVKNLLEEIKNIDLEPKQGFFAKFTPREN